MYIRSINKDKYLRKQYQRFEIWNRLNKSLEKTINFYNLSEPLLLKKKKYTVKCLYVIIVLKRDEVMGLYLFSEFLEC